MTHCIIYFIMGIVAGWYFRWYRDRKIYLDIKEKFEELKNYLRKIHMAPEDENKG